jgi:hypothetical protein
VANVGAFYLFSAQRFFTIAMTNTLAETVGHFRFMGMAKNAETFNE